MKFMERMEIYFNFLSTIKFVLKIIIPEYSGILYR